jgi:hypothetical protein
MSAADDRARHELGTAMLAITEQMSPILDAADGMRADLERRGWSPTAAETVALQWLVGAVAQVWKGAA